MFDNCLTNKIEYKADQQYLICLIMKEKYITIREFLRNFKKISAQKDTLIITKNGKPQSVFLCYEDWGKDKERTQNQKFKGLTLWDVFEKYTVKGEGKNKDKSIDEVVYGYPNPYRK